MRTRFTLLVAVGAVISAVLAVPTIAQAAPTTAPPPCSPSKALTTADRVQSRAQAINKAVFALRQSGKNDAEVVDALEADYGVRVLSHPDGGASASGVSPQVTTNAYITLSTPLIAYDGCSQTYYAIAYWDFNGNALGELMEEASYCLGCIHGGYDAFGLAFNHTVILPGEDSSAWGSSCGHYPVAEVPLWSNQDYGDVFSKQDRSNWSVCNNPSGDYNMYHGEAVVGLSPSSITCPLTVRSVYLHTWSSASVTGVTVGDGSISFDVTNSSHSWQRTSAAGIYCD